MTGDILARLDAYGVNPIGYSIGIARDWLALLDDGKACRHFRPREYRDGHLFGFIACDACDAYADEPNPCRHGMTPGPDTVPAAALPAPEAVSTLPAP